MIKDLINGITSYGQAIRHVSKYRLWGYVILPGIISLLLGIGTIALAYSLSDNVGDALDNLWPWEWGRGVVKNVAAVFGGLLVALLGLIIFKQLVMVVTAPFMSLLSEKVENQLTGKKKCASLTLRQMTSDVVRGLRIAVRNLVRELILTVILLLLGLIPVLTPFTTLAIFLVQAYFAGFGNMDFALERHFRYRESTRFVSRHKGLTIGNGLVFLALLFTFIGFLFAISLGTVAATIETVKRLREIKPATENLRR